nr:uncharacterized protein LOC111414004 [Onthophagus taurus]
MLVKLLLIFLLSVTFCNEIGAEESCAAELGPARDFVSSVDNNLYLSWMPPLGFENCAVDYNLHIQNANTSQYLTPVQNLTNLNFVFDYDKNDQICIDVKSTLYANHDSETSVTYSYNFLDPVAELGAPASFVVNNTDEALILTWTPPIGYEKCYYFFMYSVSIASKETGEYIFAWNMGFYSFTFPYPEYLPSFCQDAVVNIMAYYRGRPGGSISTNIVFGPPKLCGRNK